MTARIGKYVRVDARDDRPITGHLAGLADSAFADDSPAGRGGLTFVDIVADAARPSGESDRLTSALQGVGQELFGFDALILRWPWLAGPGQPPDVDLIDRWIARLTGAGGGPRVVPEHISLGIVQHEVGAPPTHRWSGQPEDGPTVLAHARAVELRQLLEKGHAIWTPGSFHYRLPSGDHVETFIRMADAFRSPRDVFVVTTWLAERLRSGIGIVADTGSMTPVLSQLEAFGERFGWEVGRTSVMDSYPASRSAVRRSVESALNPLADHVMSLLSVNSSGSLRTLLDEELERVANMYGLVWSNDVVVDRHADEAECRQLDPNETVRSISWLGLGQEKPMASTGRCALCANPDKAHLVAIDPRTYGQLVFPRPQLVMPDPAYAAGASGFWRRVHDVSGIAFDANPHPASKIARGKRFPLPVRPFFELIAQPEGLADVVLKRAGQLDETTRDSLAATGLVVAASHDLATVQWPEFAGPGSTDLGASLQVVLEALGVGSSVPVLADDDDQLGGAAQQAVAEGKPILVFSWAAVTGLTLRRLKIHAADAINSTNRVDVNGLVLVSRPAQPNEWKAAANQFRPGVLVDLWSSTFPWYSPFRDEFELLDRSGDEFEGLSPAGQAFLDRRRAFLRYHDTVTMPADAADPEDDWSPRFAAHRDGGPHPTEVFWGMSDGVPHQAHVRGHSLYGPELGIAAAFAAIGSTVNFTRHDQQAKAAPRWVMFNMGRLVHSYFDAIIVCSILRWLRPGELWWGSDSGDDDAFATVDSVRFLIDQAPDATEQVLLLPELLLASAQGKLPSNTRDEVRRLAESISAEWPTDPEYDLARGAVEIGLRLTAR